MTEQERLKNEIEFAKTEIIKNERLFRCIKICDTPKSLLNIRLDDLPVLYTLDHLRKALKNKQYNKHYHGITEEQIMNIPKLIEDPALIMFDSNKKHNADLMIFVEDYDKDRMPIIYNIKVKGYGNYNEKRTKTNMMLTIFGTDTMERDIARELENKNIIYYNKDKIENIFATKKIQGLLNQRSQRQMLQDLSKLESNTILQYYHKVVKIDYSKDRSIDKDIEDLKSIDEKSTAFEGTSAKAEEAVQKNIKDKDKKDLEASKDIKKERIKNKENEIGE